MRIGICFECPYKFVSLVHLIFPADFMKFNHIDLQNEKWRKPKPAPYDIPIPRAIICPWQKEQSFECHNEQQNTSS